MTKETEVLTTHEEMGRESFLTQLKYLKTLQDYIDKNVAKKLKEMPEDPYESPVTKDLNTSLAKAQGQFPKIGFNQENPYFKNRYADLNTIVHAIKPILEKHGLSFTQQEELHRDGSVTLHTKLRHSSGQWCETRARLVPKKADEQSYGSALTYRKRYSLCSLLGITTTDDPSDDDAELAVYDTRKAFAKGTALNTKYNPKENAGEVITKEQLADLEYELSEYDDVAEMVLDGLKIQSLADMPKDKYHVSINRIRDIKNKREGRN